MWKCRWQWAERTFSSWDDEVLGSCDGIHIISLTTYKGAAKWEKPFTLASDLEISRIFYNNGMSHLVKGNVVRKTATHTNTKSIILYELSTF